MSRHVLPMSIPTVPAKTPLGHEELRQRTRRLGQRHRTVLLLVDGRRPLAEVLSMAHQAGAQTAHFEELLRLGMVELPSLPEPPELPEPPTDLPDDALVDACGVEPVPEAAAGAPAAAPCAAPALHEAVGADGSAVPEAPPAAPAVVPAAPPVEPAASAAAAVAAPAPPAAAPAPAPPATEERLDEARRLLIDTLRRDTLLLRVFAPARVRAAQTQDELIGLVWEIERERAHVRRKRGQLLNLQRARDLLGMGNTVVAEDSLPWTPPDEEEG